jgi:hypothetical protein
MLRKKKIFGPKKKDIVMEGLRELHNEELHSYIALIMLG